MGRRLLLMMGLFLTLAWSPAGVRAQNLPDPVPLPAGEAGAFPPIEPVTGEKAGGPGASGSAAKAAPAPRPAQPAAEGVRQVPIAAEPANAAAKEQGPAEPDVGATAAPGARGEKQPSRPTKPAPRKGATPRDPDIIQAAADGDTPIPAGGSDPKAAVPAPAAAGDAAEPEIAPVVLPPEKLTLGKQDVGVSVEVVAPPTMNYKQKSQVKILVKNTGSVDAYGVTVRDKLPNGLTHISSDPPARIVNGFLKWDMGVLPAGSDRPITLVVLPTIEVGSMDHAATVTFQAGSKATTRIQRPKLKLEVVQSPLGSDILRGQSAEFRISVTNIGDGPARNVVIKAKLSPGLQHENGDRNEENSFELPIDHLAADQREELDPLTVDAKQGGDQFCKVSVSSPDVIDQEGLEVVRAIKVVEPKLKVELVAPVERITDSIASYKIRVTNPGTATAKNVKIAATLPVSGRLVIAPEGRYDASTRKLQWTIPSLPPSAGGKEVGAERVLAFDVRMGGVGIYTVSVAGKGDGGLTALDSRDTHVKGMPDVDLVVKEKKRVVDVDGETIFTIYLRNYGTKEATNLKVRAVLSPNLEVVETGGGVPATRPEDKKYVLEFQNIPQLGNNKESKLLIKVRVMKDDPPFASCQVFVSHDDQKQEIMDMAGVKVQQIRQATAIKP